MAKTIEQLDREVRALKLLLKKHIEQMMKAEKERGRLIKQLTKQVEALLQR